MSNTLAIATVTAVLEGRINALLNAAGLAGFEVIVDHPKGDSPGAGVYIKPYRVVPSAALRNADLPTRRSEGSLSNRPRLAIDIDVLLSFVGEAGTYDPERLVGLIMTDLHANPSLGKQEIKDFISGLADGHVLEDADIGDQLERVRFTPLALNLEDLARVWGLFGLSVYGLSIAYQVGPLLLDAEVRPTTSLPALGTGLHVVPNIAPVITAVSSSGFSQPLARIGDTLIVRGSGLRGSSTWLRIGEVEHELALADVGVDRITLVLDAGLGLLAGVRSVQIVHRAELGPPADPLRDVAQSNTMAFALLPKLVGSPTNAPGSGQVRVVVEPLPGPDQEVALILDKLPAGGQIESSVFAPDNTELVFTVPGLIASDYLVRVRIDGVVSMLDIGGPNQTYDSPKVTVT